MKEVNFIIGYYNKLFPLGFTDKEFESWCKIYPFFKHFSEPEQEDLKYLTNFIPLELSEISKIQKEQTNWTVKFDSNSGSKC